MEPTPATTKSVNDDLNLKIARTDEEIEACFPVMAELRPHLQRADFLKTIRDMEHHGYTLAFLSAGDRILAVAGYRIKRMLCCEPFLYVDDLVTTATERSRGYGTTFLAWLIEQAREEGCTQLHLDSGIQREDAHRFYKKNGLIVSGLHFRTDVKPTSGAL
jgi:GNAT superfamily N-acetyltransferase